ncbi:hypothetical protein Avbf_14559 [Armadillidium vulgare]|nr:hypothetical protein Avbf_14559 [Armadillidium vulgare]
MCSVIMFHSKKFFYSLLVLSIIVCLSSCDFNDLCDVSNDCDGKEARTRVQDPLDCHRFYECVLDSEGEVKVSNISILCPNFGYFNEEDQQCEEERLTCANKCANHLCINSCEGLPDKTRIALPYPYTCNDYLVCDQESQNMQFVELVQKKPHTSMVQNVLLIYVHAATICTPYCQFFLRNTFINLFAFAANNTVNQY